MKSNVRITIMSIARDIYERRELLFNLVSRNLKSRYKDSVLGFLWSILTPLFMAFIYMVFLRILNRNTPMEQVLIGVFAWQFTAQCVGNGLTSITDNSNLVKKIYFPRMILPLATTLSNLITFLLTLVVQFILVAGMLALRGQYLSVWVFAIPLLIIFQTVFCLAISIFLSAVNVYFRDIQHLVSVLLTAWFFMSPAMYSLSMVEGILHAKPVLMKLYMLNPMACIITGYRALILPGVAFPTMDIAASVGVLVLLFLIFSYFLFQKLQRNFADLF